MTETYEPEGRCRNCGDLQRVIDELRQENERLAVALEEANARADSAEQEAYYAQQRACEQTQESGRLAAKAKQEARAAREAAEHAEWRCRQQKRKAEEEAHWARLTGRHY